MKYLLKSTLAASIIALSSNAFAVTTLKFAHAAPESDLQQDLALFFKKEVEARTKGDIKINIYPQGQLGSDKQMIDGSRAGIIDFAMVGLNNYNGMMPESSAFTLPFMFPDRETAYKVLDGKPGKEILNKFKKFGLKGLGYPENGYRNITNNEKPIREPSDLKGLQMRVNGSKALNDMFAILQANPQQLPVSELYTALETGVVDSQDHPIPVTLSFKFNEVQKYLSLTQHAYSPLVITMNLRKFNRLSNNNKKIIEKVAAEAVAMQRKLSIAKEDQMIAQLEAGGMKVNRDVNGKAFQQAIQPVWNAYVAKNSDDMIKKIKLASK